VERPLRASADLERRPYRLGACGDGVGCLVKDARMSGRGGVRHVTMVCDVAPGV